MLKKTNKKNIYLLSLKLTDVDGDVFYDAGEWTLTLEGSFLESEF
jgi:hypothetical protein